MRRMLGGLAVATLLVATTGPVAALTRTTATWTEANPGPAVFWATVGFAPTTCRMVVHGGTNGDVIPTRTSLFDPVANTWTTLPAARVAPTASTSGAMAWHPGLKRLVLFGGRTSRGVSQETWAFDPAARAWAPLVTKCRTGQCPPARWGHAMVWSSRINRVVLFGGTTNSWETFFDDVWTFNGTWSKAATSGPRPSGRFLFGMAEDAATGMIVVYGGSTHGITSLNDTWLLNPTTMQWTKVTTPTTPPSYGEVAMAWSPSLGAVVQTGGSDALAQTTHDPGTWAFDSPGRTWVQVATSGAPTARKTAALVTDACQSTAILFGGTQEPIPVNFTDRTWILR